MKEKLQLSKKDARNLISEDLPGYKVIQDRIVDHGRWTVSHEVVVQRESDGKFFKGGYRRGATESQDEMPFEYDEPDFAEVEKKEKIIYVYE